MGTRCRKACFGGMICGILFFSSCGHSASPASGGHSAASSQASSFPPAPAAEATGGFDGARAYKHVEQLVAIGPHSAGSEGIHRAQAYIIEQLKSFGCPVEEQDFHASSTPVGDVAMKNILVKIPSTNPNIILYASHYDTKRIPDFVGADDGGSSTGVLLEFARLVCARKNAETIWLAFLDGEEAFNLQWADPDNTYGSRELAASLALSGELRRVKAMILVDMVGPGHPVYKRESNSTPWLTDFLWSTAARLGYGNVFVNDSTAIEDDHLPFLERDVPAADIIDLDVPYWHTKQDTLDKIDPRTLAITGHVLIASLPELEKKIQ
jgi:Zn-dependent M28 family amino/carboxypeptidase